MDHRVNGIYGRPATGLKKDSSWAKNEAVARIGASGEVRTAEELNIFSSQAAVFHDLRVPIPKFASNIDHVIVTGKKVLLIDTKVWKPGFYWTLGAAGRRGLKRFDHLEKDQTWLVQAVERYLQGTGAKVLPVHIAVWPHGTGKVNTTFLKIPGAKVVAAAGLRALVERNLERSPSSTEITSRLRTLVVGPPLRPAAGSERF